MISRPRPAEDNMDTAARVLALAQQTADQAIADARREADETLGRARREADDILTKARRQAEQVTSDARARAESLERDAQERHRQAMGSLVQSREELERRVDDLRAFEREYRSRLKAYLEGQLRDLEAGAADSGVFPAVGTGPQQSPVGVGMGRLDMRNGSPSAGYQPMPEAVAHNGGFHPSDAGQHDRR
jgi:vacuolar-type H+-ATPase subunit H